MSSYLVCHVQKFGGADLKGVGIHNDRESENSKNKDIDYSRTSQNFDALTGIEGNPKTNYKKEVEDRIEKFYRGKRAIRKDAVKLVSVLVSADHDFFKDMEKEEIKRFFAESSSYLANRFGAENVVSAKVHMDEHTPHMHFTFVPLRDGKLTAKTIIDRKELKRLQDELPMRLQDAGYDIKRGRENSPQQHLDVLDFKRVKSAEKLQAMEIEKVANGFRKGAVKTKSGFLGLIGKDAMRITAQDYNNARLIMHDYAALRKDYDGLARERELIKTYKAEIDTLREENRDMKELELHYPREMAQLRERLRQERAEEERRMRLERARYERLQEQRRREREEERQLREAEEREEKERQLREAELQKSASKLEIGESLKTENETTVKTQDSEKAQKVQEITQEKPKRKRRVTVRRENSSNRGDKGRGRSR